MNEKLMNLYLLKIKDIISKICSDNSNYNIDKHQKFDSASFNSKEIAKDYIQDLIHDKNTMKTFCYSKFYGYFMFNEDLSVLWQLETNYRDPIEFAFSDDGKYLIIYDQDCDSPHAQGSFLCIYDSYSGEELYFDWMDPEITPNWDINEILTDFIEKHK